MNLEQLFDGKSKFDVIQPGDLVHCDFGITYLTLNTDCQELAYVLKPEETEAPKFLREALVQGNAVQDALTDHFKEGRTGNATLKMAIDAIKIDTSQMTPQEVEMIAIKHINEKKQ